MKKIFKTKHISSKNKDDIIPENKVETGKIEKFFKDTAIEKPITPKSQTASLLSVVILSLIFGFVAGFLALILFLSGTFSQWLNLDITSFLPAANVVVKNEREITVTADENLNDVRQSVATAVVSVYPFLEQGTKISDNIYQAKDFLGNGLVLTSDGWIATTNDVITNVQLDYSVITSNNKIYKVDQIKSDKSLGMVFLKIDANDLTVTSLVDSNNVDVTDQVVLSAGYNDFSQNFIVTRIGSKNFELNDNLIRNSEDYFLFVSLAQKMDNKFLGTPIFNLNKEMVGFLTEYKGTQYVLPSDYFKKSFNQIITLGEIKKTYLGIEYINFVQAPYEDSSKVGVLITDIKQDSPLIKKVEVGDIITKIDNEIVNGHKNFTNFIQQFRSGDNLTLTILDKNDRTESEITVELK